MDQAQLPNLAYRREEDIALDLFKFIAAATGAGKSTAPSTGFVPAGSPKPEDQVNSMLELYSRCLGAIKGK